MALDTDTLRSTFSAVTYDEIRQDSLVLSALTNQRWTQDWVAGARQTYIPIPNFGAPSDTSDNTATDPMSAVGVEVNTRTKGGDWGAMTEAGSSDLTFTWTGSRQASVFVAYEDSIEASFPVLEEYRSNQVYAIRNAIDSAMLGSMRTMPNNTVTRGDGSAGVGINAAGTPLGSTTAAQNTSRKLVFDVIDDWSMKVETRDLNSEASDSVGSVYMVMHPYLFRNLRDYMIAQDFHWDELTASLLRDNSLLAGRGFKGRLFGVDIFSSNKMPVPSGSTAATRWDFFAGTQTAVAANIRPPLVQFHAPEGNQITAQPGTVLRQIMDYGILELDGAARMERYRIDAHATD